MKTINRVISVILTLSIVYSCTTSAYITDPVSAHRQKEMMSNRTGTNILEGSLFVVSTIVAVFTGVVIAPKPQEQSFRKMVLLSQSKDTLFINMVTNYQWKESGYADIRDIVLPPFKKAKVIVPMGAAYNVYFRNNYFAPDDEKIEINTSNKRRLKLKPMVFRQDTTIIKPELINK
ncbi:MAG: hypothetical protein WCP85_19700 [Mariniphaga sp.]